MKKITTLLPILFLAILVNAQSYTVPRGLPSKDSRAWVEHVGFVSIDSLLMMPQSTDSSMKPSYPALKYFNFPSGGGWYEYSVDSTKWKPITNYGGGGGGSSTFFSLTDVDSTGMRDGYIPYYDLASGNILFEPLQDGSGTVFDTSFTYAVLDSLNTPPFHQAQVMYMKLEQYQRAHGLDMKVILLHGTVVHGILPIQQQDNYYTIQQQIL